MNKLPKGRSSTNAIASGDAAPDEHEVRQRRDSGNERGAARKSNHTSYEPADTSARAPPPRRSVTMTNADRLPAPLLKRKAVVYVRQSTQTQVQVTWRASVASTNSSISPSGRDRGSLNLMASARRIFKPKICGL